MRLPTLDQPTIPLKVVTPQPPAEAEGPDPQAVEQARREIQTLVHELTQIAKSDIEPSAFYEELLSRLISALAAVGGAVWTVGAGSQLELAYQINLQQTGLQANEAHLQQHAALLHETLVSGQAQLVPPHAGDKRRGNPTEFLLVLGPIASEEGPLGLVEIFQRPNTRPGVQRGFLRFVQQMCELASDYWKSRRLRSLSDKQNLWEQLNRFTRTIHHKLDTAATAYSIANEGRRLIGCDRVSVAIGHGRRHRITAVSGQDTFDGRSNIITRLTKLVNAVTATGEPLWYTGSTEQLAPQVERALQAYLDLAHSKALAVLPLARPTAEESPRHKPEILGALVVEQIEDSRVGAGLPARVDAVVEHSSAALANAIDHESLFLLPVWRTLGRLKVVTSARMLPRTLSVLLLLAGLFSALILVPADFELEAKGTLQPVERREVFAGIDGVVIDVPVEHGVPVAAQQVVAKLRNTDLEVQIADVLGRRKATAQQIQSIQRSMLSENRMSVEEKNRLSGQLLQLQKTYESLTRQLELFRSKQAQLDVTSPIGGQVVTWQVHERLLRRPVRQGQILMSIANPEGPWKLELQMPEDRMGHIADAAQASSEPLRVTYVVATRPGETHVGRVKKIEAAAEVRGEAGNTVLIDVDIDKSELHDLRPGASVTAKVYCGQRSLGYVWLHDVIAFVQQKILFRL